MNKRKWLTKGLEPALAAELRRLRDAAPWHELASFLDLLLGSELYAPPAVKAVLGAACGLSPGIVQRYVGTLTRVRNIAKMDGVAAENLLVGGFNAVEAACRLRDRSPELGRAVFKRLAAGGIGLEEIRRNIADAGPGAAGAASGSFARGRVVRRRAEGADLVEDALIASAQRLFGPGAVVRRRPGLRFFRRRGFEVVVADGRIAAGLDVLAPQAGQQRDELDLALGSSALLATYLPRFFWVFAPGTAPDLPQHAAEILEAFGLPWFGVLEVDASGRVAEVRPSVGRPEPDRTALYGLLKEHYVIRRRHDPN